MSVLYDDELTVDTAGYGGEDTLSYIGAVSCGRIEDGIGLRHNDEGGWVISFTGLEKIYLAAKKDRENLESHIDDFAMKIKSRQMHTRQCERYTTLQIKIGKLLKKQWLDDPEIQSLSKTERDILWLTPKWQKRWRIYNKITKRMKYHRDHL